MATHFTKFISTKRPAKPANDDMMLSAPKEDEYPYGMQITIDKHMIEQHDIDLESCCIGATMHFCCIGKVQKIEGADSFGGPCITLQIVEIACENEDDENEEMMSEMSAKTAKSRYGAKKEDIDD